MKIFQEKRQFRSRLYSRTVLFALIILIVFLGKGVFDIYGKERQSARMRAEAEGRLGELQAQRANLERETTKLQSVEGIEEKIRSKFNVAKPGENVVLIVDDATTTATSTPGFFASLWAKIWNQK